MQHWIRFGHLGKARFRTINPYEGDMFDSPNAMNESISLGEVTVLTPSQPSKLVAMWNNFHALAAKLEIAIPKEPLYFLKGPNSFLAHGQKIKAPTAYINLISQDMSLLPGDMIACGTSVGVGSMKPGSKIEIVIDGIGKLSNEYE